MSTEMWLTLAILAVAVTLFVTERLRIDVVALGVLVALMALNVLTPQETLSGFANDTVISFAALFVVGGAVFRTGLAALISDRVLRVAGTGQTRLLVVLMLAVGTFSAFISSTGVVALMLPAVVTIARRTHTAPSKLLIPMTTAALIGGASTLIGTPPNLIASENLVINGYPALNFFDFTPIGIGMLIATTLYMVFIGQRLLPENRSGGSIQRMADASRLVSHYKLPDNLYRLRIDDGSPTDGSLISQIALRSRYGLNVLSIQRTSEAAGLYVTPSTRLQRGDVMIVQGDVERARLAAADLRLSVLTDQPVTEHSIINDDIGIAEVLLPPRAGLLDKTLAESRFASTYNLTVLDILRPDARARLDLSETRFEFGDVLLVTGFWTNIAELQGQSDDFVLLGHLEDVEVEKRVDRRQAFTAGAILLIMIALIITNVMPLVMASLSAALAMILMRCLTMDEAYQAIDWKTIILTAGMLPLGTALVKVGLVDMIASQMVGTLGTLGVTAVALGLFGLTVVFTQFVSNTASTALIAPIALAAAQQSGVQPQAFVVAVALAASLAFASPVASPVNTLVMGAGGYRYLDYTRVGLPLIIVCAIVALVLIPLLFPL
ncbi:MAG TPA: SLC13 family permease [Aggregatilineales bacterium]|nr:SLC13 family permease [Aggregatilineales bacterium]